MSAGRPQRSAPKVRSVLVLGGARSGKSRYAQSLIEASGLARVFVATGIAFDDEMRSRIAHHRADRGASWRTIEEPIALVPVLARDVHPDCAVLVDCLTLWLTNVLLAGHDAGWESERLADQVRTLAGPVVFVSNEVGSGIVPDNALSRGFRDAQGRLNQAMAAVCDGVVLVTAGLPRLLKPSDDPVPLL